MISFFCWKIGGPPRSTRSESYKSFLNLYIKSLLSEIRSLPQHPPYLKSPHTKATNFGKSTRSQNIYQKQLPASVILKMSVEDPPDPWWYDEEKYGADSDDDDDDRNEEDYEQDPYEEARVRIGARYPPYDIQYQVPEEDEYYTDDED